MMLWDTINNNLATIWLLLIGFFLLYYALTDGADLGIGILTLFTRDPEEREAMMQSIHTTWHGNQTWLVIMAGMLFGAFPLFYSIVLSALYIPFTLMLFGFIFRGVAFEFHANAKRKSIWIYSFGMGSLIATLAQGFALGGLLGGIEVEYEKFAGRSWDWANWHAAVVAAGVFCGFLMLGAGFLIAKTTGRLQERSYKAAEVSGLLTLLVSGAVYVQISILHEEMAAKWVVWPPSLLYLFLVLALGAFAMFFISLRRKKQLAPMVWNWLVIIFSFTGLSIGLYPNMIPSVISHSLTVQEAAAGPLTLRFMLGVTAVLLPVILVYTTYSYWIFRGKTTGESYGNSD
ncbi:MAG: cytochrome d ubiquinol oxidase subunit II [Desulfobulbaceae bacterium]|nr:cytochrome d ubiquinol oxidase subunit II [Desulfobulbaceae bacterium]